MVDGPRFLTLPDVAEILNTSLAQVTALVRREDLRALKLGGRGQWRVETTELEAFIQRMYAETQEHLREQRRGHTGSDRTADSSTSRDQASGSDKAIG